MSDSITRTITARLTSSLDSAFLSQNNLPLSKSLLTTVIPSISSSVAKDTTKIVNKEANFQLNEIPKNAIGQHNPVNIVSSNLTTNSLNDTLRNNLGSQVNSEVTNSVVQKVDDILRLNLPGGSNNPTLINLKTSILNAVQNDVNKIINLALSSFTSGVFNTGKTIPPIVPQIDSLFTSSDPEIGLQKYNDQYNSSLVAKSFAEARQFNVLNEENLNKLQVTKTGFVDPTASFPTEEYKNRPDTNKLATGDLNGTIVQKKNEERMVGAKLPGDSSWSQPESPYKGEYPYNKVTQTEQGHIIEIDDTPGAERLHIYHKSGTFVEIDANGSLVKRTKGSDYEIIDRNGYVSIAGKADISINGACNIFVGNDANIEVEGDTNITCHNDITAQAGGVFRLSAVESFSIRSANVYIEADNELNLLSSNITKISSSVIHSNASTNMFVTSKDYYGKTENDYFLEVTQDSHHKVAGDYYVTSDNFYGKQSTSLYMESGDDQHYKVTGNFNVDVDGIIDLVNGTAASSETASGSVKATKALNSFAGLLTGRKDINYIDLSDPLFLTVADRYVLSAEEQGASESEINATKNKAIKDGIVPKENFLSVPVSLESDNPTTNNTQYVDPGNELKSITEAPDNFKLSPNFTLGMLSSKAAVTKNKLVAQAGKSYGDLLFNLSAVALNICEPVLRLYPNMYVTSAFRLSAGSSSTSQHPLGQAVDIQFKGVNKKEYFEIAKVLATKLNYDQLLLEYASTTNNPWIHISIDPAKRNRTQVLTFNDHSKFSDGLSQLA